MRKTWRQGDLETWRQGDEETWRSGDEETWRSGDLETRRSGDLAKGVRQYASPILPISHSPHPLVSPSPALRILKIGTQL
ncbi:hypothetical protein CRP01_11005 [Flavilitoribacter nigricans DSM 23189 = NBRC 102662]|uniref:Uncharacterized protein n=1 Tax=Flavilitoribacter nigricans (strain ATCC 23147 / DSM 23189 / NBRC 102662 / NCIMB 1420 / SS-2) TaxID=1122177 RepID=A0A2D0NEH0_FLAN2|nr:hypothetical protein CRP01_11005 [Flavilitoribacter nigricans DSM 23189 = NBRC 102662]